MGRRGAAAASPTQVRRHAPSERALLRAADELHNGCDVSDPTWAVLAEHYDAPALVEILFVVGQYTMLSMVANAAGIPA